MRVLALAMLLLAAPGRAQTHAPSVALSTEEAIGLATAWIVEGRLDEADALLRQLAAALPPDPQVLLLDEPSAGLAPAFVDAIFEKTQEVNQEGVTIVMVEQNARRALAMSDRGYVLDLGQDRFEGPGKDLLEDEKENSEHLMLVDLGRNDLGRVCTPGTVEVHDFRHIERYSHVMHLVSQVTGRLAEGKGPVDAFAATFPAGTLSGAPKPSALAILDEFEDTRRGVYGGTVGYFDFRGNTDQAIAIRTGLVKDGTVFVQAGGGIVADSDPDDEDLETVNKAAAVLRAVAAAETLRTAGVEETK